MAGAGRAPQHNHQRARDDHQLDTLSNPGGEVYGDPLPLGMLPNGEDWHPMTLALWDALRRNPLLANEPPLGWQFLIDTALMHHTMWDKGKWEFASEVRLRVAKFGATPEDRMRLKIKVDAPRPVVNPTPATVRSINSRRSRLSED